MESITRRPAALFCLAFVFVGFAGVHLPAAVRWSFAALCAVLLAAGFLPAARFRVPSLRRSVRILLCALLCGNVFFSVYTDGIVRADIRRLDGRTAEVTGVVQRCEYALSYEAGYIVRLTSPDARCTVLLETPDTSLSAGDRIRCTAVFSAFAEQDGSFAEERYYFSKGIRLRAEAESAAVTGTGSAGISGFFAELRTGLRARLSASLGRESAALPAALFLGDRSLLPDSLTRDFSRLGISHLLAISGLHFTLLLGGAERILSAFLPSKKPRLLLAAGLSVLYMLLSGMSESVLRAGLMLLIANSAVLFSRREDLPTALGAAAFLICTVNPAAFYSPGLQLSVTAVLALACVTHMKARVGAKKPVTRIRRALAAAGESMLTTAAVQLVILPLLCLYFGEASLLTPAASLLFTPLILLILLLTPLLLLLPAASPLVGALRSLCGVTAELASALASPRGITLPLNYALCPLFAFLITAAFFLLTFTRGRRQTALAAGALCLVTGSFCIYMGGMLAADASVNTVVSSVYKKNDAIIIASEGKFLLCDISDGSYAAMSAACGTARQYHATELEALLLTHLHARHIRSFDRLSDTERIRALILPAPQTESEADIVQSLAACAEAKGIPLFTYDAGDAVQFAGVRLYPDRVYISRSTHPVITLTAEADGRSVQYLGASWNEAGGDITGNVLLFGAHGPVYKKEFTLPAVPGGRPILLRGESGDYLRGMPAVRQEEGAVQLLP